jgi:hypothetical protein
MTERPKSPTAETEVETLAGFLRRQANVSAKSFGEDDLDVLLFEWAARIVQAARPCLYCGSPLGRRVFPGGHRCCRCCPDCSHPAEPAELEELAPTEDGWRRFRVAGGSTYPWPSDASWVERFERDRERP